MAEPQPEVALISTFSSPGAEPTDWREAREALAEAEIYWLSTVRPEGSPHVTPLLGVWRGGAFCFCTGSGERKARNLSENHHCVVTTGNNALAGLDVVLEGVAEVMRDPVELADVAETFESKYGAQFTEPDGTWSGLGDAIRGAEVLLYRVMPVTVFGFGKGEIYSQTRWSFP